MRGDRTQTLRSAPGLKGRERARGQVLKEAGDLGAVADSDAGCPGSPVESGHLRALLPLRGLHWLPQL